MMLPCGVFTTMITPFKKDNSVDYDCAEALTHWYVRNGCHGIFAVCQSSELYHLTLEERVKLVERISAAAEKEREQGHPVSVIASGHVSCEPEQQVRELTAMYQAGADAVVLITNRMDFANRGDDAWIRDTRDLLERLPPEIPLGLYECPSPYKRLLSDRMLQWCASSGRFYFIKDTCCDHQLIAHRLELLQGTDIQLFNANSATLLESLKAGCAGYCGVMANFHPALYRWLFDHYQDRPEQAEQVAAVLSMASFTEALPYPVTAKYYLSHFEGIPMEEAARTRPASELRPHDRLVMQQIKLLSDRLLADLESGLPERK